MHVLNVFPQVSEVDINVELFGVLSEEIDPGSVSSNTVIISPVVDNPAIYVDPLEPRKIVISPDSNLQQNTVYKVVFTTGIKGRSGAPLMNDYQWSFRTTNDATPTHDVTPPIVSSVIPFNEAPNVSVLAKIIIVFSERMQITSISPGTIKLINDHGQEIPTYVTSSPSKRTFIVNPVGPLNHGKTYIARVTTGVQDLAGNAIAADYESRFTTEGTPPSPSSDYTNYDEEWKACRSTADKLDGILVDLRKYGFSFLTGLTTAGSFLGLASPAQNIQVGVIIVTMVLVVVLYWLDGYYQKLLFGCVFRNRFLELFKINRGLSIYISGLYGAGQIGGILHSLYIGFVVGLFILGLFSTNFINTVGTTSMTKEIMTAFWVLLGALISTFSAIIILYLLSYHRLIKTAKEMSNLLKEYRKYYIREGDEKLRNLMVNTLENKLMNILETYL